MNTVRQRMLQVMAAAVERTLPSFDPKTGRFLTPPTGPVAPGAKPDEVGWFICNQDIVYPLAVLYTTPGTRFHQDSALLEIAFRAGDAIRDFQYPDGQVEFLKADGSRWGPTYMPWTNYAWLEAYALLQGHMEPARRQRWAAGLTLAHDGQAREISKGHVHNIPCWKAMSCYRAGQLLGQPAWQAAGSAMIERVVAEQQPEGFWNEHGGPTTAYNFIYVHGLGLYYRFSGDERLLPALEAAAEFHQTFAYPDGSPVETIDGRVKYHGGLPLMGWVGLSAAPKGRRLTRYWAERINASKDVKSFQGGAIASSVQHLFEGGETEILLDRDSFRASFHTQALVCRSKPWFACLSAVATPPVASRWGQDRQAFLSLWHDDCGLLLGGGNSKDQAEWSSFVAGGRLLPDQGGLLPEGDGVALQYGKVRCTLRLRFEGNAVRIEGAAEGGPALQQFIVWAKGGETVRSEQGLEAKLGADAIYWRPQQLGAWLEIAGCRIEVPHGADFRWPTAAFNPYAIDGAAPFGAEHGMLAARLDGKPVNWTIRQRQAEMIQA